MGSSMIGSEKVEIPTAVVCIGTTITKLAIVRPDVKCYSIKKLLSHFYNIDKGHTQCRSGVI